MKKKSKNERSAILSNSLNSLVWLCRKIMYVTQYFVGYIHLIMSKIQNNVKMNND